MGGIQRKVLIGVLSAGTFLGFGAGFASLRQKSCARREAFERHVADVCVEAARREQGRGDREGAPGGRGEGAEESRRHRR